MSKRTARPPETRDGLPAYRRVGLRFEALEARLVLSAGGIHPVPLIHAATPSPRVLATPMIVAAGALGTASTVATPMGSPSALPPAGSTSPAQMRRFYGVDNINFAGVPGDGRGMTIAIIDAYDNPTALSDLQHFDAYYGLPDPPNFQVVNEFGSTSNLPGADPTGIWGIEGALDVQWAHAMAPLANIVLVEVTTAEQGELFQAAAMAANLPNVVAVSMSFGVPEVSYETMYDSNFTTPAGHGGVTFLAATGDGGTPGTYPAYSPNVVAVGGTSINAAADGSYINESAWGGGGAGVSTVEPRPSWQNGVQPSAFRTIPDISMDADPATGVSIYNANNFGTSTPWAKYGGTSLGTPMFAGLVAVADQGRVSVGQSRLDSRTQTLPGLYATVVRSDYHDITTGASTGGASATVGYDLATGLGSPIGNLLMNHLAGASSVIPTSTGTASNDNFTLTLDTDHLYVDWSNGITSGQTAVVDINGLTLNGSGGSDTLTLNFSNGNPLPNLLKLNGTFTLVGLIGSNPLAGKTIDMNRSTLYVNYAAGSDPLATIQQYLANGYNGSAWNGQPTAVNGVITSSAAATNASRNTSIGYVDSADGTGYNPVANSIKLVYTLMGDSNLDGAVNSTDYNNLAAHYKQAGAFVWDQGSFDYTGSVTFASFAMVAANYNQVVGSLATAAGTVGTSSGSTTIADVPALTPVTTTTSTTPTTSTSNTTSGVTPGAGITPAPAPTPTTPSTPPAGHSARGRRADRPASRAVTPLVATTSSHDNSSDNSHGHGRDCDD